MSAIGGNDAISKSFGDTSINFTPVKKDDEEIKSKFGPDNFPGGLFTVPNNNQVACNYAGQGDSTGGIYT